METPGSTEKLDLNDISFDDIVGTDNTLMDEVETLGVQDDSIKETEPDAVDLKDTEEVNELDADASKVIQDDTDITEPTDKDDVDQEEIDEHFKKDSEEPVEEESESTIVGEVLEKLGFKGEYEYKDTPEGLKNLTLDVANKLAEEQLDSILDSFPLVQKHLEYVMNGGKSEKFMTANDPNADYGKMDITDKDIPMQRVVLSQYFKGKGHDDEFIKEFIEDYEDSGKLFSKAELAKNALSQIQIKERESLIVKQKADNAAKQAEERNFWKDIHTTLQEKNELAGITIPNRDKNKFFKYISNPVNKHGQTQSMVDAASNTMEQRLLMDYLLFKKLDLKDIIATKANTSTTKTLKDRIIKGNKSTLKNVAKKSKTKTNLDLNDLDFGSLMS